MNEPTREERYKDMGVALAAKATGFAIASTAIAIAGPLVVGAGLVALIVGMRIAIPDEPGDSNRA